MQDVVRYQDVLEPTWIPAYESDIEAIWFQLVDLNTHLLYIKKIEAFRFDLFQPIPTKPFWPIVKRALIDGSIMIIWRVILDSDGRTLTLSRLKKEILAHWRVDKQEEKKHFTLALKKATFKKSIQTLESAILEIRHNHLAHFNQQWNTEFGQPHPYMMLTDLLGILEAYHKVFDLLCLGNRRLLTYLAHHREDHIDIDDLLDEIARKSNLVNLREKSLERWNARRQTLSDGDLELLNAYRRKFGLQEV